MNNLDCSRLGTMLHLDIKKSKEATNTAVFQQQIGRTALYTKMLLMDKKVASS